MSAAEIAAALHALVMEHGLTIDDVPLTMAVEISEHDATGLIELQFGDGEGWEVRVRTAAL